jgi:hypothetical protein
MIINLKRAIMKPTTIKSRIKLQAFFLEGLDPNACFSAETTQSRDVRSTKLYMKLNKLIEIATRELEDHGFERTSYN